MRERGREGGREEETEGKRTGEGRRKMKVPSSVRMEMVATSRFRV